MDFDKDYYQILEISYTATAEEIKRAYRSLARRYHPDTSDQPNAVDRFREVQAAYEVLCDVTQRTAYDKRRREMGLAPDEGATLLVDYGQRDRDFDQHHAGHAVYARPEWLLFHAEQVAERLYAHEMRKVA